MSPINRSELLKHFKEPDEKLLFAGVLNQACLCYSNDEPFFTDFFDPSRIALFLNTLEPFKKFIDFRAFGGYENAERRIIGFFPKNADESFPILGVSASFNEKFGAPSHRDILGAVLGLGIKRCVVGDIVSPGSGTYIIIAKDKIAPFISSNLLKCGKITVKCQIIQTISNVFTHTTRTPKNATVQSLRLDAVTAAAFNLSRGDSARLFKQEKVLLNWLPAVSPAKEAKQGDIISVRGLGRVGLFEICGLTKRGRISIKLDIY